MTSAVGKVYGSQCNESVLFVAYQLTQNTWRHVLEAGLVVYRVFTERLVPPFLWYDRWFLPICYVSRRMA